jgi:hypothetical protein
MEDAFPADFLKLPPSEQKAILTGMKETVKLAYDRVVPVVISRPPNAAEPSALQSASGFFVVIAGQTYLGTARHVWRIFHARHAADARVRFQAGRFAIEPAAKGVIEDESRDTVLIPVADRDAQRSGQTISSTPLGWPPPAPAIGSFVVFSGCPEMNREHDTADHVGIGCFSSLMRVTDVSAYGLICQFERDTWIWDGPNDPPPPGSKLSGMSGGPVFSLDGISIPLVGLIRDFVDKWEVLHVATFAGMQVPQE